MSPIHSTTVELVKPFPEESLQNAWEWLRQFPDSNFDDYGPTTFKEFEVEMKNRAKREKTWGVLNNGFLCGMIAYWPLTLRLGTFHGIVFSRAVHGTGVAKRAVRMVLEELFSAGVEKISVNYFSETPKIGPFLRSLGFFQEGRLREHTLQHGRAIDVVMAAAFAQGRSQSEFVAPP
jgi:RimJ/RimL family protein N-acetyltransferase